MHCETLFRYIFTSIHRQIRYIILFIFFAISERYTLVKLILQNYARGIIKVLHKILQ
jgi:hypothetical protein